jgi:hypothetical protein
MSTKCGYSYSRTTRPVTTRHERPSTANGRSSATRIALQLFERVRALSCFSHPSTSVVVPIQGTHPLPTNDRYPDSRDIIQLPIAQSNRTIELLPFDVNSRRGRSSNNSAARQCNSQHKEKFVSASKVQDNTASSNSLLMSVAPTAMTMSGSFEGPNAISL